MAGLAAEGGPRVESTSARLRGKIDLVSGGLAEVFGAFFAHGNLAALVPEYFLQLHATIRASVPLMEVAAARARAMAGDDPVADGVARYLDAHVPEERHHDDWLLDDLEVLGVDRAAVLARLVSPTVASLVGCQYYWALHDHPVALLGYMACLEGYPPPAHVIDHLVAASGHPRRAFSTLAHHGHADVDHRAELDRVLDALPLTLRHESLLGLSAMSTMHLLAVALEEVVASVPANVDRQ